MAAASSCCCGCPYAKETEFSQNANSAHLPPFYFFACGKSTQHPLKGGLIKTTNADAFLIDRQVVGVADGVSSVEAEGYDPSRLPVELLTECSVASRERQQNPSLYDAESESLWSTWDVPDFDIREFPRHILARASASCKTWGATTCVLCILDKNFLWTVNVGDSQALHLRRTNTPPSHALINRNIDHSACYSVRSRIADLSFCGGYQIVQRVAAQQHFFNCPFQLTRMPDSDCSFGELLRRTSVSADVAKHEVQGGDIVIVGSDGLFDNLFDEDILQVVNELCWHRSRPGEAPTIEPFQVAERLLEAAMSAASPAATAAGCVTPYAQSAFFELGRCLQGGKPDDITVVVSYVLDRQSSTKTPGLPTANEDTEAASPRTSRRSLKEGDRWPGREFVPVSRNADGEPPQTDNLFSGDPNNAVTRTYEVKHHLTVGSPSSIVRTQGQEPPAEKRAQLDGGGAPNAPLCMTSGTGSLLRSVPVQYNSSPDFRIEIQDRPSSGTGNRERGTALEKSTVPVFRSAATGSTSSAGGATWGYASLASALQCSRGSFPGGNSSSRIASVTPACVAAVHSVPKEK